MVSERVQKKRHERRMWSNHKRYLKRRHIIEQGWRERQQALLDAIVAKRYAMRPGAPAAPVKQRHGFIRRFFNRVTARITGRK